MGASSRIPGSCRKFYLHEIQIGSGPTQPSVQWIQGTLFLRSDDQCMKLYPPPCDKRLLHSGFSVKVFHLNCREVVRDFSVRPLQLICCLKSWLMWIMCSGCCKTECAIVSNEWRILCVRQCYCVLVWYTYCMLWQFSAWPFFIVKVTLFHCFKLEDYKIHICWVVGDYDAVLVLLLFPWLLRKAEILLSHKQDKFPPVVKIERIAVVRDHAVEQFAFKSGLSHYVYSLQVCSLFVYKFLTTHFSRAQ